MPTQLRLQPSQLTDLAVIRYTSTNLLETVAEGLSTMAKPPLRPPELHRHIGKLLGEKSKSANNVMRVLLGLHAVIRQRKITPDEVLEGVRYGLENAEHPWDAAEFERWRSVEPSFRKLLVSSVVRLVSKALDVTYEHENLLQSARVVTDIRPIFNDDATQIDGAVVSHTIRLRYDNTSGDHSISVALDESDIRELEKQCKRALLKAQTSRSLMADQARVPTVISGDGDNAEA